MFNFDLIYFEIINYFCLFNHNFKFTFIYYAICSELYLIYFKNQIYDFNRFYFRKYFINSIYFKINDLNLNDFRN